MKKQINLRPKLFKDIIGQEKVKEVLEIAIKSAKMRNDALGHVLLDARPGHGKSMFSIAIANELKVNVKTILGSNIKSFKDILPTIVKMECKDVLFIDEIHRVNTKIAESLYTVLEDFRIDIPSGEEIITIDLPRFTIIGATTEVGTLAEPLRDRFKLRFTLSSYSNDEISQILKMNCEKLDLNLSGEAVSVLAGASRGTPRIANRLLEWVRDYSIVKGFKRISVSNIETSLSMQEVGLDGSTKNDRLYVEFLKQQKKPVGLNTLSASLGLDVDTINNVIEPWLLKKGIIGKSTKGRYVV